jgi:hypothetical protein
MKGGQFAHPFLYVIFCDDLVYLVVFYVPYMLLELLTIIFSSIPE